MEFNHQQWRRETCSLQACLKISWAFNGFSLHPSLVRITSAAGQVSDTLVRRAMAPPSQWAARTSPARSRIFRTAGGLTPQLTTQSEASARNDSSTVDELARSTVTSFSSSTNGSNRNFAQKKRTTWKKKTESAFLRCWLACIGMVKPNDYSLIYQGTM